MRARGARPARTSPGSEAGLASRTARLGRRGGPAAASPWPLRNGEIESALRSGERARELESYFGEALYTELRALATQAARRDLRGRRQRVLILPGLMGSTLGRRRLLVDDVIWIDPIDILAGQLRQLALGAGRSRIEALGALALVYLRLKLTLGLDGFDAEYFPFDWRQSPRALGELLARRVAREAGPVHVVAHSMGGLVARAAIASQPAAMKKLGRLVMLGTPNHGSFAAVQALRGTHDLVQKLALFDLREDPEELASRVLQTFPSLHQLLPAASEWSDIDLYDARAWPKRGLRPRQPLLDEARSWPSHLAPADRRFFLIAGVNEPTVTNLTLAADGTEFVYESTDAGDGIVPLAFAELRGAKTFYVEESHGSLPMNGAVARAVCGLFRGDVTNALPDRRPELRRRALPARRREAELRVPPYGGRKREQLQQRELRLLLEEVASPESRDATDRAGPAAAVAAAAPSRTGVVVGRRRQRRLDVKLALGSLSEADAEALLVGIFAHVDPGGAAGALDVFLGGAIRDLTQRRMFNGRSGEVFVLPVRRLRLPTENVVFTGLGPPEFYGEETQQLAAENAMRGLLRARIDECATVLFGSRPGPAPARSLENLMTGFLRALRDADPEGRFRSITFCELDPRKFEEMRSELYRLATTDLFGDTEITVDELRLPEAAPLSQATRALGGGPEPLYLLVREETRTRGRLGLRAAVLTAGGKATVLSAERVISEADLLAKLAEIERPSFDFARLPGFGAELADLVLPEEIQAALAGFGEAHLVVVHDEGASRIPWETLAVAGRALAGGRGISRRYVAQNLSPAKWLADRVTGPTLDVLLVANPTEDLPGAEQEGARLRKLFGAQSRLRIQVIEGAGATKKRLLEAFRSGEWDVVHYAGHAYFDAVHPARSGILCHGDEVLAGSDLASLSNLPSLVFFNACEAARIRGRRPAGKREPRNIAQRIERNVSFAEAFLRGGIANYIGTYWPVGDEGAERFSSTFYAGLLGGRPVGEALSEAREALIEAELVDWTDYVHFGSYDFVVKASG